MGIDGSLRAQRVSADGFGGIPGGVRPPLRGTVVDDEAPPGLLLGDEARHLDTGGSPLRQRLPQVAGGVRAGLRQPIGELAVGGRDL
jgi:hypothetical protein